MWKMDKGKKWDWKLTVDEEVKHRSRERELCFLLRLIEPFRLPSAPKSRALILSLKIQD